MKAITINGASFAWKLRMKEAKALGISGPGNGSAMAEALQRYADDWDAAQAFVLAGCVEADKERVRTAMQDWGIDDFTAFIEQAFAPKAPASAATVQ